MRIELFTVLAGLFLITACGPSTKTEVANELGFPEPQEWILVVHPEGCKTCLDSFYSELQLLPKESPGAIVLITKNSKTLRLHPFIGSSPIPLYLDEQKLLIQKGFVQMTDQILLFRNDNFKSFDILDFESALREIR